MERAAGSGTTTSRMRNSANVAGERWTLTLELGPQQRRQRRSQEPPQWSQRAIGGIVDCHDGFADPSIGLEHTDHPLLFGAMACHLAIFAHLHHLITIAI